MINEKVKKEGADSRKMRGGYYTPQSIANFICQWAIRDVTEQVLEPSCGDGNFIEAAVERFKELGLADTELLGRIQGVELLNDEAEKSKQRVAKYGLNSTTIVNDDFFSYASSLGDQKFDVVVGNPPFIRYQNFPEQHRTLAFSMMVEMGLNPNKLTNIWVPFLVLSAGLLKATGRLAMVIPAELFQVKYAAETRIFLSSFFERITIVTFKKLVFKEIQQEIVLLLCEKSVTSHPGIRVVELESLDGLDTLKVASIQKKDVKRLEHDKEKWTKYFLETSEIKLMRRLRSDHRIRLAGELMITNVGLVTGLNDFFMINEQLAEKWGIKSYTKKVVSKSSHFKGIGFTQVDFQDNSDSNFDGLLFLPPDVDFDLLPEECQAYIAYGESKGYHLGYKCRIRKRWYITPSIYSPDAFALRQVSDYPKLIVNHTDASSTDTIHRVRFLPGVSSELVTISYLNSLTFAFSEITGRSYGGGVLTFEPTEIGELPLPLLSDSTVNFTEIDTLIRQRRIEEVLDIVDRQLLINQLGFDENEVNQLRVIWRKLSGRRLNRNKS